MEMMNCSKNRIYFINGHLFYWTFFLVRPMLIPSYWLRVIEQLQQDNISSIPSYLLIINIILSMTIDTLNVIWTAFVSKGTCMTHSRILMTHLLFLDYYRRLKNQYKEKLN